MWPRAAWQGSLWATSATSSTARRGAGDLPSGELE